MAQNELSAREEEEEEQRNQARSIALDSPDAETFFIRLLLEKQVETLNPHIEFAKGVVYPEVASILHDKNSSEIEAFLQKLANDGFLERKLVDRIIKCSSCGSPEVYSKYRCEKCQSFNISLVEILVHPLCGYSGSKSNFLASPRGSSYLICPKCKRVVGTTTTPTTGATKKDYTSFGKIFECNSCGSRFDSPTIVHKCKKCNTVFTYNEANYSPVYKYTLSSKTVGDFMGGHFSLPAIAEWFKREGFNAEAPKDLVGKSGAVHHFDIVLSTGTMKNLLFGDFSVSLDEEKILTAFAKRYDVNPDAKSFVVTHNKASKAIENLSNLYDISIIYMDAIGSSSSLDEQLSRMVGAIPQRIPISRAAFETQDNSSKRLQQTIAPAQITNKNIPKKRTIEEEEELPDYYFQNDTSKEEEDDDEYDVYLI